MLSSKLFRVVAALIAGVALWSAPAAAQNYPTQPIRIIVPTPPGGVADLLARAVAQGIADNTGKTVDRRAAHRRRRRDRRRLRRQVGARRLHDLHGLPSDPVDPAAPAEAALRSGQGFRADHPGRLLAQHAGRASSLPAKTPKELVDYARKNPGKVSFGSPGNGSSGHMVGEQFKIMHKLDLVHVPYKGAGPAVIDLVAGHIQMMFDIVPLAREQMLAGKVRALGVMSPQRLPVVPDVPTMAEQGMPELEGGPWFGLLAPAKTPRPIIDWLNAETRKAMAEPGHPREARGARRGAAARQRRRISASTSSTRRERWGDIIKRAGIKL